MCDRLSSPRYNLDPDGSKSDADVWKALEIAQLKPLISELPSQLGEFSLGYVVLNAYWLLRAVKSCDTGVLPQFRCRSLMALENYNA